MTEQEKRLDLGGILVAVALVLAACVALWDTTNMTDADSFVFPRAVAVAMICFCIVFIILQLTKPSIGRNDEAGITGGSNIRRIGLVTAMIGSALLMPWLGFLVSGALAFGSIMLLAMHDAWTPVRRLMYPLVGLAVVVGFYFLFAELLLVPLPIGSLFD